MAFTIANEHYKSEGKNHVRNWLSQHPSHEYDDFKRRFPGARNIARHIFKEVKADMQKAGELPIIQGDKAYRIIEREVEQKLKQEMQAKQEEEAAMVQAEPTPEPAPPTTTTAAPSPDFLPAEPMFAEAPAPTSSAGMVLDSTPRIDRLRRTGRVLTIEQTIQIENLLIDMPDLASKEIVDFMKIDGLTRDNVTHLRFTLNRINPQLFEGASATMPTGKQTLPQNKPIQDKIRANLLTIGRSEVLSMTASVYEKRFKHTPPNRFHFATVKRQLQTQWERDKAEGRPYTSRAAAMPSYNGSNGSNGSASHRVPVVIGLPPGESEAPVLAPGVVIAKLSDQLYAEGERRVLKNVLPRIIKDALAKFGIHCPDLTTALVELDDDSRFLEIRVK
jgi:hypothetical protein